MTKKNNAIIQFRADEDIYSRAKERLSKNPGMFPDVMRAALRAVAEGDTAPFADIIRESGGDNGVSGKAWLYHKCHELFELREGKLFRKSRKGMGEQGTEVYIRKKEGESHVIVQGESYPLKEIVWLMKTGSIPGEVLYKNPYRVSGKHDFDNLFVKTSLPDEIMLTKYLSGSEKIAISNGKQRAIIFDAEKGSGTEKAIENLINKGKTIPLLLRGENSWRIWRTAINAVKINDGKYMISIS